MKIAWYLSMTWVYIRNIKFQPMSLHYVFLSEKRFIIVCCFLVYICKQRWNLFLRYLRQTLCLKKGVRKLWLGHSSVYPAHYLVLHVWPFELNLQTNLNTEGRKKYRHILRNEKKNNIKLNAIYKYYLSCECNCIEYYKFIPVF